MPWTIVIAGEDEKRLAAALKHAKSVSKPSRILVVSERADRTSVNKVLFDHPEVVLVEEPCWRGTTPTVLLPLLHALACDRCAPVFVLPADHPAVDDESLSASARAMLDTCGPGRLALVVSSAPQAGLPIVVAEARTLAGMFAHRAPGWWRTLTWAVGREDRLHAAYEMLPAADFVTGVLSQPSAPTETLVAAK